MTLCESNERVTSMYGGEQRAATVSIPVGVMASRDAFELESLGW
jgi:hypothetical protein